MQVSTCRESYFSRIFSLQFVSIVCIVEKRQVPANSETATRLDRSRLRISQIARIFLAPPNSSWAVSHGVPSPAPDLASDARDGSEHAAAMASTSAYHGRADRRRSGPRSDLIAERIRDLILRDEFSSVPTPMQRREFARHIKRNRWLQPLFLNQNQKAVDTQQKRVVQQVQCLKSCSAQDS